MAKKLTQEELDAMQLQKGTFTLTDKKPQFPTSDDEKHIPMKGFTGIKIWGQINNPLIIVSLFFIKGSSDPIRQPIKKEIYKIYDAMDFPFIDDSGYIIFEAECKDINMEVTINFELI